MTREKILRFAFVFFFLAVCGCKITEPPAEGSIRYDDGSRGVLAREGLAFSRLITSPVQLPLTYAGLYSYFFDDGKPMRFGYTDPFSKALCSLLQGSVVGPICICEEIGVSLVEILSTVQFNSVIYPWETYGFYKRSPNLEKKIEQANSPEMLEIRRRSHERLKEVAVDVAEVAVEVAGEVAAEAVEQAVVESVQRKMHVKGGGAASGGGARTGYAIIKGPGSLAMGKSARYQLCIGGKPVDCEWAGGTSLTVSQSGRVLAGNPPIKSGRYRATIKARYNGKEYSKTIYIVK